MRKSKIVIYILILVLGFFFISGCREKENNETKEPQIENKTIFKPIVYENVAEVSNIDLYQADVKKDGNNNDDPVDNGIVKGAFHSLKVNGIDVPVYSTRCGQSTHSFAWIDIENPEEDLVLNIEINLLKKTFKNVVVLPESKNVVATITENVVTAQITSYGSFSFVFDRKPDQPLTIYVAKAEKFENKENYEVIEFAPGNYSLKDTNFTKQNTIYYFKKGFYSLASIYVPSNSVLYFESGSYFHVVTESKADTNAAIRSANETNIEIKGRGLFDFSSSQGGDAKFKGVFDFHNIDKIRFSGIVTINPNSWGLCFTNSNDVLVEHNMVLGYRTYADGIMLSDCQDSLVRYNFVRTGDDAIEAKSTGSEGTRNLVYEYNDVWTDKARAYGLIYESNNDMNNVIFRNNTVGFALATWTDRLGVCCVAMGDRKTSTWQNVYFENIEIYMAHHSLINITLADHDSKGDGGIAKNIYFKNIKCYRLYSWAVRIQVQKGSTLGRVYLDNIEYNNKKLTVQELTNKDEVIILHYISTWQKNNLKLDTLVDK